ncbi:deoxycytidylate deaminase [Salisediminibacterium selenitireducens]|uniref:CMP/dCMP deaminase zinc-binding protein n=1 Tax=Bacillus selenitireducens (strain ATCC 700615 / DSM 15326 / MLS10) TaxID=439292 RepID=D6XZ93_BACIE|nr:cytidine/deoxycytidylate deaminase family protein [Salisediminibacterium selenitireducens]ADI00378.1 CMP/dCMP deaminase zinc-binding protein [[Bacillus] selenitireducens MLS10]
MSILKEIKALVSTIPLGERDDWEQYFMSKAYIASLRSTCGSRRVGAVIVNSLDKDKRNILSTGYNGYPSGQPHCVDGGCPRFEAKKQGLIQSGEYQDEYPCDAFHAEANAMFQMQRRGISTEGCVLFSTTFPCRQCAEKINGAGIRSVYYSEGYPDAVSKAYLERYGIEVIRVED